VARFVTVAAVCALACATAAGCGTGDRERDVAAVVERFHAALARDDGATACEELSTAAAGAVEQQEEAPCEEAILRLDLPRDAIVGQSRVYLRSASVEVDDSGATFLEEGPSGWKVSAAGCTPTAPGKPYDCELEG
jgi:hypothetical protein